MKTTGIITVRYAVEHPPEMKEEARNRLMQSFNMMHLYSQTHPQVEGDLTLTIEVVDTKIEE